jgi:N-methylhydantoinase B
MSSTQSAHKTSDQTSGPILDSVELAVLNSRFEGVVRAMLNPLVRSARTGVLGVAHDLSCCILTANDELLAWAESLPIHVVSGPDIMCRSMKQFHSSFKRGDAFLHNSPYHGCSHAADWTLLVPVIDDNGVHRFTVFAKAHQGDCGNAEPTTYSFRPRDVYEEGALIFPCIKIQQDYQDNTDIIRMCRQRIRVPDQWWGDYLAMVGAVRIGEARVLELMREVGIDRLESYARQWFDYSEQRMEAAIGRLPSGRQVTVTRHDGFEAIPEGIPLRVEVNVDAAAGRIVVDLRDNPDCQPCGLNLSEACSRTAAMIGIFYVVGGDVPPNAGSFRRLEVLLRENCCVGIPRHPASCSTATSDLMDRIANCTLRGLTQMADGVGMAEFGLCQPPAGAVISGHDPRNGNRFINQLCLAVTGGPGGVQQDGWLTAYNVGTSGMLHKDSVEIDEWKHPIRVIEQRLIPDSEGAGRTRGAPGAYVEFEPVGCAIEVMTNSDGHETPASGVHGGQDGTRAKAYRRLTTGELVELPGLHRITLKEGETVVSISCGGGGYGPPEKREPQRVVKDVREGWITVERARDIYRVVLTPEGNYDAEATRQLRRNDSASSYQNETLV